MSLNTYKIYRWDAVMTAANDKPTPMIYIKPDTKLLDFLRENNFRILVKIDNTGTIYDGKYIWGVVDKSSNMPSCRPNFDTETGFYVVTLEAFWYGYPKVGKEGNMLVQTPTVYPTPKKESFLDTYASDPPCLNSSESNNSNNSNDSDDSDDSKEYRHKNRLFENVSTFLLFLIMFLLLILAVQKFT